MSARGPAPRSSAPVALASACRAGSLAEGGRVSGADRAQGARGAAREREGARLPAGRAGPRPRRPELSRLPLAGAPLRLRAPRLPQLPPGGRPLPAGCGCGCGCGASLWSRGGRTHGRPARSLQRSRSARTPAPHAPRRARALLGWAPPPSPRRWARPAMGGARGRRGRPQRCLRPTCARGWSVPPRAPRGTPLSAPGSRGSGACIGMLALQSTLPQRTLILLFPQLPRPQRGSRLPAPPLQLQLARPERGNWGPPLFPGFLPEREAERPGAPAHVAVVGEGQKAENKAAPVPMRAGALRPAPWGDLAPCWAGHLISAWIRSAEATLRADAGQPESPPRGRPRPCVDPAGCARCAGNWR